MQKPPESLKGFFFFFLFKPNFPNEESTSSFGNHPLEKSLWCDAASLTLIWTT